MKRDEAIAGLEKHAEAVKAMGSTAPYVFGSTVSDNSKANSDLDVFIDYDPIGTFSLIDLVGIKQYLEEQMSIDIGLTTRSSLHPMLRAGIEDTAVRIF